MPNTSFADDNFVRYPARESFRLLDTGLEDQLVESGFGDEGRLLLSADAVCNPDLMPLVSHDAINAIAPESSSISTLRSWRASRHRPPHHRVPTRRERRHGI